MMRQPVGPCRPPPPRPHESRDRPLRERALPGVDRASPDGRRDLACVPGSAGSGAGGVVGQGGTAGRLRGAPQGPAGRLREAPRCEGEGELRAGLYFQAALRAGGASLRRSVRRGPGARGRPGRAAPVLRRLRRRGHPRSAVARARARVAEGGFSRPVRSGISPGRSGGRRDRELANVRDAIDALPEAEPEGWRKLWSDVDAALAAALTPGGR